MQITNNTKKVTRSHGFEEGGFKIEASPVMFEILSSRIYTDVPLAIVRELSTNAADAHVEAGNAAAQFDVHLPTTFDSFFSIRDYGTGLSPADVTEVYTVFGASTRRTSNDFTGCLGLGSKTPFAYADQFTITSFLNGKRTVYSAFKNEENLPAISLMGESETDEPNGVLIQINIDPNDIHRFQDAARKVYQHFPVRPNFIGVSVEFTETEPIMEGDGWKLFDDRYALPARVSVLMGKICYAANGGEITNELGDGVYLLLEVGIGDCSIAANREELQYDDHTNTNLQRLLTAATEEVRAQIDDKLTNADCKLTRAIERLKYRHIIQLDAESASFKLNDYEPLPDGAPEESKPKARYTMWGVETRRKGTQLSIDRSVEYIRPHNQWKKGYTFVENDLPENEKLRAMHKRRLRHWLQNDQQSFLVTITDRPAYLEIFGEPTIKLSDLPDVPRETVTTSSGDKVTPTYIKVLRINQSRRLDSEWLNLDDDEIDTTDGAYVPRQAYRAVWGGSHVDPNNVREVATLIGVETVYGLSKSRADKLAKSTGLDSLEDKAREWIQAYVDNASDEVLCMLANGESGYSRWHHDGIEQYIDSCIMTTIRPGMSDVADAVLARRGEKAPTHIHRRLINHFNIAIPTVTLPTVEAVAEAFLDRYPLLKNLSSYGVDKANIVEYIELMEAKHVASATI